MADAIVGKKNVIDRMSSLPDDVLLHVISFLPIVDSTRICFLSTRFQKLSRSIPILVCRDKGYSLRIQFTKFMKNALSNHEKLQRVQKFHLRCSNYKYSRSATISKWIDSVVTASVSTLQELHVHVDRRGAKRVKLPSSVFSCQKLKFLNLVGDIIVDEIPTALHLPCLKTLELVSILIVSKNPLNNPLSTVCSVLEFSLIKDCCLKILRENKKNYTCLNFEHIQGSWVQADCPEHMVLKQLELQDIDMLAIVEVMGREVINPSFFPNLTQLKFKVSRIGQFPFLLSLLLQHSPMLTFLELKILVDYRDENIIQWDVPATTVYQCLLHNLETVKIIDHCYKFQSQGVIKYFLKNAKVLKKLVLYVRRPLIDEIKASIVDEPKASGQCEVEFVSV